MMRSTMSDKEVRLALELLAETCDKILDRLEAVERWQAEWDAAAEAWDSGEMTVMFTPEFDDKKTH